MADQDQFDPRAVVRMLRRYERTATELSRSEEPFDPVTYTDEFPDGTLTVTISAEAGPVTIAFYDPDSNQTVVMTLGELRQRIADL